MSTANFDALPGVETPVAEVRRALAAIWEFEATPGSPAPSEYRASQLNLVLHLGLDNTPEHVRQAFDTARRFSRRYPCRIIALCPRAPGSGGDVVAKIYCECFIGQSRHDMTCTEAIALSYPLEQRRYLEDQASIMLESDLPLYYWPQRIAVASRLGDYRLFLREAQRVVIDSAVERPEVPAFDWPRPEIVRDLVFARTLPVRQSLGHFLSYLEPARIARGLQRIEVRHRRESAAEARALLGWARRGVADCAAQAGIEAAAPELAVREEERPGISIAADWSYADGGRIAFACDFAASTAHLEVALGSEHATVNGQATLLPPENALAEALFFS